MGTDLAVYCLNRLLRRNNEERIRGGNSFGAQNEGANVLLGLRSVQQTWEMTAQCWHGARQQVSTKQFKRAIARAALNAAHNERHLVCVASDENVHVKLALGGRGYGLTTHRQAATHTCNMDRDAVSPQGTT